MFCPKCGSLLMPKKEDKKKILACHCGYKDKNAEPAVIREKIKKAEKLSVVEKDEEIDTLPKMDAECPKCSHKKAYYWLVQTRASDEPETKFLKCEKCRHTWRDYN